jgi:hypothetical protein
LLDITVNNNAIPGDWKKAIVVPIYKGGDWSLVLNYRLVSLTLVVCRQMEHIIAGYLRQVWEMSEWYMRVSMFLDQATHVKEISSDLSGYCGFTGWGSQNRRDNNRFFIVFRFSSIW